MINLTGAIVTSRNCDVTLTFSEAGPKVMVTNSASKAITFARSRLPEQLIFRKPLYFRVFFQVLTNH